MSIPTHELWWRHIPLYDDPDPDLKLANVVRRVLNDVEEAWPKKSDQADKLFAVAKSQSINYRTRSAAVLALSLQNGGREGTARHSLIYIAALMNNPIAISSMPAILRWKKRMMATLAGETGVEPVYDRWVDRFRDADISVEILKQAVANIEAARTFEASVKLPHDVKAHVFSHSLQVLTEIGDADSTEGQRLAKSYATLRKPLELKSPAFSLDVLEGQLIHEFPWLDEITVSFIRKLKHRANVGQPWIRLPPTLLVGPPGCGKTRYLRRLSELTGCGHQIFSAGGSSDCRMLIGTARGWHSAQPCLPLMAMHIHGTANPIIVVDEIEKAQTSHNGGVHEGLLSFLELESSRSFYDECLLTKANLGEISWFATANSMNGIPDALLSRLNIYEVKGPRFEDFDVILDALRGDYAKELGIQASELPGVNETVRARLQLAFADGKSIRQIKRALASAIELEEWRPVSH